MEERMERKYKMTSADALMIAADLDRDTAFSATLKKIVADDPSVRQMLISGLTNEFHKKLNKPVRNPVVIPRLATEDEVRLRRNFPSVQIRTRDTAQVNGHPIAQASRRCELAEILEKLRCSPDLELVGKDVHVKDIGGNMSMYLNSDIDVHVCAPALDGRDLCRHMTSLYNTSLVGPDAVKHYNETLSKNICAKRGENCFVSSYANIYLHSIYDMTPAQVCDSMLASGACVGYATMMMTPKVFVEEITTGTIPELQAYYTIDKKNGRKRIIFGFDDDPSWQYIHDYENYMTLIRSNVYYSSDGVNLVFVEAEKLVGGILTLKLYGVGAINIPRTVFRRSFQSVFGSFKVVTTWKFTPTIFGPRFNRRSILCPKNLFSEIHEHAFRQKEGAFVLNNLYTASTAFASREIVKGQSIIRPRETLHDEELYTVTSAIYLKTFCDRYNQSQVNKLQIQQENIVRGTSGVLKDYFKFWGVFLYMHFWKWVGWILPMPFSYLLGINVEVVDADNAFVCEDQVSRYMEDNNIVVNSNMPVEEPLRFPRPPMRVIRYSDEIIREEDLDEIFPMNERPEEKKALVDIARVDNVFITYGECYGILHDDFVDVEGDGNCLYRAFAQYFGDQGDWLSIKLELLAKTKALGDLFAEEVLDTEDGTPGDVSVFPVFVACYNTTICLHEDGKLCRHWVFEGIGDNVCHLKYVPGAGAVGHYQYLGQTEIGDISKFGVKIPRGVAGDFKELELKECSIPTADACFKYDPKKEVFNEKVWETKPRVDPRRHINVCWYKFAEIMAEVKRIHPLSAIDKILDVGGGPGGFAKWAMDKNFEVHGLSSVIDYDERILHHPLFTRVGSDIMSVILARKYRLMVCDIAVDNNEDVEYALISRFIELVRDHLEEGGVFVYKCRLPGDRLRALIRECMLFADAKILRLKSSNPLNNEVYVICQRKTPGSYSEVSDVYVHLAVEKLFAGRKQHFARWLSLLSAPIHKFRTLRDVCESVGQIVRRSQRYALGNVDVVVSQCGYPNIVQVVEVPGLLESVRYADGVMSIRLPDYNDNTVTGMKKAYIDLLDKMYKTALDNNIQQLQMSVLMHGLSADDFSSVVLRVLSAQSVGKLEFVILAENDILYWALCRLFRDKTCGGAIIAPQDPNFGKALDDMVDENKRIKRLAAVGCGMVSVPLLPLLSRLDYGWVKDIPLLDVKMFDRIMDYTVSGVTTLKDSAPSINIEPGDINIDLGTVVDWLFDVVKTMANDFVFATVEDFVGKYAEHRVKDYLKIIETKMVLKQPEMVVMRRYSNRISDLKGFKKEKQEKQEIWEKQEKILPKSCEQPELEMQKVVSGKIENNMFNEAVQEQFMIWDETDKMMVNRHREYLNYYLSGNYYNLDADVQFVRITGRVGKKANILWIRKDKKPKDTDIRFFFDGDDFVNREQMEPNKLYVCSKDSKIYLENQLRKVSREEPVIEPTIVLVEGVPGCGKTTYILNQKQKEDLIVTATKEGKTDIAKRLGKEEGKVRTIQSAILHSKIWLQNNKDFSGTLYVDEGLMVHPGSIILLGRLLKATKIYVMGDRNQIPYIERQPELARILKYDKLSKLPISYGDNLNVSYRCPADVACVASVLYEGGMTSASGVTHSTMAWKTINSPVDVPKSGVRVLVFTQGEKEEMKTAGFPDCCTIHEYQGKQEDEIYLVRLRVKVMEIYSSMPHILVAISRHKKKFTYYTVVYDDLVKTIDDVSKKNFRAFVHGVGGGPVLSRDMCGQVRPLVDQVAVEHGLYDSAGLMPVDFVPKPQHSCLVLDYSDEIDPDLDLLRWYYEMIFIGDSYRYSELDEEMIENTSFDYDLCFDGMEWSRSALPYIKPWFDFMESVISTSIPAMRYASQQQTKLALFKRNLNPPALSTIIDVDRQVNIMVDRFVDTYILHRGVFDDFDEVVFSKNEVEEWLSNQPLVNLNQILAEIPFECRELKRYQFIIKRTVKPNVEGCSGDKYGALQTVTYQPKDVNVFFCPLFKILKKRLQGVLNKNFKIFTDVSLADFEDLLNRDFGYLGHKEHIEVDMSKYDKSQDEVALRFEVRMMRLLGAPEWVCDMWYEIHANPIIRDFKNKVTVKLEYQRRSGDAATFFGNTMFLMAILADAYAGKFDYGVFAGDDSVLWGDDKFHDEALYLSKAYNVESKIVHKESIYFCSRFLVHDTLAWSVVNDPIKMLIKMGKKDLRNSRHLREYGVSLRDNSKSLARNVMNPYLEQAVRDRYLIGLNMHILFALLVACTAQDVLEEIFVDTGGNLCEDPSLPKER